jgi:hypothetical protein
MLFVSFVLLLCRFKAVDGRRERRDDLGGLDRGFAARVKYRVEGAVGTDTWDRRSDGDGTVEGKKGRYGHI